jgi:erythromycin esterase-like protein
MNSKILFDAENYYQVMISSGPESWNVRDDHMADTLDSLMNFHGPNAKCIVWAHNTHIGDARFTDMIEQGERNLGQIVRERHEKEGVFLVGFGTNEGTVIAGEAWDAQWEDLMVPSAPANSWEWMFKQAEEKNDTSDKLLIFPQLPKEDRKIFEEVRGHRAIGVVYDPAMDRFGHWVPTVLGKRYDAFIYVDKTKSLHPLPDEPDLELQPPMTYPWGALV